MFSATKRETENFEVRKAKMDRRYMKDESAKESMKEVVVKTRKMDVFNGTQQRRLRRVRQTQ